MEVIVPDQIIMGLILYAGDAKQHIYKALEYVKNEEAYERCEEEIKLADAALLEAHNLQTQFLAQEASGTKTEITALFVHSQDHLMTTMTEINLIKEIISLRIKNNKLKEVNLKNNLKLEELDISFNKIRKLVCFVLQDFLQVC